MSLAFAWRVHQGDRAGEKPSGRPKYQQPDLSLQGHFLPVPQNPAGDHERAEAFEREQKQL